VITPQHPKAGWIQSQNFRTSESGSSACTGQNKNQMSI
jgi:hypothetical protein